MLHIRPYSLRVLTQLCFLRQIRLLMATNMKLGYITKLNHRMKELNEPNLIHGNASPLIRHSQLSYQVEHITHMI